MRTSKLKVAYILTPITFGGAEKVNLNFLRAVNRDRFDIRPVLLVRPWDEELYFARELRRLDYAFTTVPVALRTDGDPLRVMRVASRLHAYLRGERFDVVHTHGYFADICGQFAARLLGIKGISTCHGFIAADLKLRCYNMLDKCFLRLCRTIIAVSEGIKAELMRSGIRDIRIKVIANAVSSSCGSSEKMARRQESRSRLGLRPEDFVVGYLGRLSVEKGLNFLVDAAAELASGDDKVKLVLIGDGPERQALERQAKESGLDGSVIFTGFLTDPENWYPALDLFALPSLTEGTPLALLESMSAGVPVIASAVGGVPKVVTDEVNGMLIPPGDAGAIKERVRLLKKDRALARRLGCAGAEHIKENFSIPRWCQAIESCYYA